MSDKKNHPVWEVYDLYRTARLNVKYFSCRLAQLEKINFWIEFTLALTASSAVVAFNFWKTPVGAVAWQVLSILAAILAVVKPLLKLTEKIRASEEIISGFKSLEIDLKGISLLVQQKNAFDQVCMDKLLTSIERTKELFTKAQKVEEDKKLIQRCHQEVLRELPTASFFIPS